MNDKYSLYVWFTTDCWYISQDCPILTGEIDWEDDDKYLEADGEIEIESTVASYLLNMSPAKIVDVNNNTIFKIDSNSAIYEL